MEDGLTNTVQAGKARQKGSVSCKAAKKTKKVLVQKPIGSSTSVASAQVLTAFEQVENEQRFYYYKVLYWHKEFLSPESILSSAIFILLQEKKNSKNLF